MRSDKLWPTVCPEFPSYEFVNPRLGVLPGILLVWYLSSHVFFEHLFKGVFDKRLRDVDFGRYSLVFQIIKILMATRGGYKLNKVRME